MNLMQPRDGLQAFSGSKILEKARNPTRLRFLSWEQEVLLRLLALGQIAGIILMIETPARAYVDPGTGLLTLQMLGASVAGGLFMLRRKIRQIFAKSEHPSMNVPPDTLVAHADERKCKRIA